MENQGKMKAGTKEWKEGSSPRIRIANDGRIDMILVQNWFGELQRLIPTPWPRPPSSADPSWWNLRD